MIMINKYKDYSLFLVMFMFIILIHPSLCACNNNNNVTELVDMVCDKTSNYTFCVESLYSDHQTPNADPYALASVAFRLAYRNATTTRDYIAKLLNNSSCSSRHYREILVRCEDDYKEAESAIEKGYKDLNSQTYLELAYLADVASDDAEDCQESLQGKTGHYYNYYSMIEFLNKDLKGLCQICVAISKLLA